MIRHVTCMVLGLALTVGRSGAVAAPIPVTSKLDKVLVYSTQARVTHEAWVTLGRGQAEVPLIDLPESAQQDSLRVTSRNAEVVRLQVLRTTGRLPEQAKAAALVKKMEALLDSLQDIEDERSVVQDEQSLMESLNLLRETTDDRAPRQEGLFVEAWRQILSWVEQRSQQNKTRLRQLAAQRRAQHKALHKLQVEGQGMELGQSGQRVRRVVATLKPRGAGKVKLLISYLVDRVRWVPAYDLRYVPRRRVVEATYYAVLTQKSGEDWDGARLRFSTAMPTQLLAIPELPTMVLGRKRDFTPRPPKRYESAPAPWVPPAPSEPVDPVIQHLRSLLNASNLGNLVGGTVRGQRGMLSGLGGVSKAGRGGGSGYYRGRARRRSRYGRLRSKSGYRGRDRDRDGIPDSRDQCPNNPETFNGIRDDDGCPDRGRVEVKDERRRRYKRAPARRSLDFEADDAPAAAPAEPAPAPQSTGRSYSRRERIMAGEASAGRRGPRQQTLPWTEQGYRPPALDNDLPAAAAEGYRFTLYAPGRHVVKSGGEAQRVPVLRRELRVDPYYRIAPGASGYAYLMAQVKNTTGRPILRGRANLFTGDMFSGRSWLNTALPGKSIKLPLGVDDAVKVERHIRQRTVSQGMIFKDDVSEYTVEIELANHHRYPIRVELRDQIPVAKGRKIEVKSFSAKPKMDKPDKQGLVRWEGTVKGSSVKKLKFTFRILRPKDWKLRQHNG